MKCRLLNLLTALSLLLCVAACWPMHGPPGFRYTGSDPAFHVWNLGWPLVVSSTTPGPGSMWAPSPTQWHRALALWLWGVRPCSGGCDAPLPAYAPPAATTSGDAEAVSGVRGPGEGGFK